MTEQIIGLVVIAAVLALCFIRQLPIGVAMFAATSLVGLYVAHLSLAESWAGFPISLVLLLVGVTFFFGIAQANGTIEKLVDLALRRVGDRTSLIPVVFSVLAAAAASMGNPFNAVMLFPIGMYVASRRSIDPMLMGIALGVGVSAGAFAPTGLFGVVTYGTAQAAEISLNRALLLGVAVLVNVILLAVAYLLFGRKDGSWTWANEPGVAPVGATDSVLENRLAARTAMTIMQKVTVLAILTLVVIVVVASLRDQTPDVGVISLILGTLLCIIDPALGKEGMARIDWTTILLVAGIVTYVGVLQQMGAIDMLGEQASKFNTPVLAALLICAIAGLVSAFASTTAMLAALVPLALPLIQSGDIPGWAMICAIGICASVVDISPFSSVGATVVASTVHEGQRPRVTRLLSRWGLSMIVIGPLVMVGGLVVPAMIF